MQAVKQHALLQLPPAQRTAPVMRELQGRSYAETAAAPEA